MCLFEVTDDGSTKLEVSDVLGTTVTPEYGDTVMSLTGFGHFSFCRRKIRPRSDGDISIQAFTIDCGTDPQADHLLLTEVKVSPTG